MNMWSRIGKLFSRKQSTEPHTDAANIRGTTVPAAPDPEAPTLTPVDFASESVISAASSSAGTPAVSYSAVETRPAAAAAEAETQPRDPWLAARHRPLVYAHKLKLEIGDAEEASKTAIFAREHGVDESSRTRGVSSDSLQDKPVHSPQTAPELLSLDSPPGEAASVKQRDDTTASHAIVSDPQQLGEALAVQTPAAGEQTVDRGPRFAMLRAVAQQWRPAVWKCRYLVIIGSSAEARKLAPVIRNLRAEHAYLDEVRVCIAGNKTDYIREALALLHIASDMEITFPWDSANIDEARTGMITGFGRLLMEIKPEWLLVQGDSVIVAMASIAAYYARVPVAHLDGGTLLHDTHAADESDPEVLHRRIATLFASIHFADTALGKEQLVREGVPEQNVLVTGNTGVDAMQETCAALNLQVGAGNARASGVVHVLVIAETPETIAHGLPDLCTAVRRLATSVPGLYQFVWPVVGDAASIELVNDLLDRVPGVLLSGPAGYEQYLRLLNDCDLVLTDVEDVQEEAPSLGKPVLLMQSSTDRPEAQRAGITSLTAADAASIQASIRVLARKLSVRHGAITNPYGDGRATSRIVDFFEGRQVLEFGRTALPKLIGSDGPSPSRLLTQSAR